MVGAFRCTEQFVEFDLDGGAVTVLGGMDQDDPQEVVPILITSCPVQLKPSVGPLPWPLAGK